MKKKDYKLQSVNIPIELLGKITELKNKSQANLNISNIIVMAIEKFFNSDHEFTDLLEDGKGEVLIPLDKYATLFTLSRKNVKDKISTGQLKNIMLGEFEYIVLPEDDIKNIVFQVIDIKKDYEKLLKRVEELEKK